jgi:hypothetical protein
MASANETEPWTWGCGGVCKATKQGAHVACAFCARKFHIVCLPRLCPSPELPSPSSFYICHAGCLAAYRAGADKRVYCKVDGCDHTKGFANAKALRVHIKTAHEHVTYPCSLCDQPFTSKANCDSHRVNCVRNLTSALQRQRELVLSELQHTA